MNLWHEAALTSVGFFWTALWAFALGYLISSLIQILVTRSRMRRAMGTAGPRSMALGAFFGFVSSSCSFAALSTTRALFQKGAGLAPSMAFLLASTNLVIELGIVIAIFLGWQFVLGEYLGGLLLIAFAWAFIALTRPHRLVAAAREHLGDEGGGGGDDDGGGWLDKLTSLDGWTAIARTYVMEWQMVWKDVLIGFTAAGIIAAFVPDAFFQALFVGSGTTSAADPGLLALLAQAVVGPIAAFCTFIGSMGNIPLAALLFSHDVSYGGVMAFIFSDLVVLPVVRINARYYGWRMALYILVMLLSGLVITALLLHYGLAAMDWLPEPTGVGRVTQREHFAFDFGFVLNAVFLGASAVLVVLARRGGDRPHGGGRDSPLPRLIDVVAGLAASWLAAGLLMPAGPA